jgi:glycosyltransferase involved in cell wall biosynthesis
VLDFSALRRFQPLIATPCHGNSVFLNYVLSAIRFQNACFSAGMRLDFFFRQGDSLVTRARNDCVAYFLSQPEFTHLLWIDADIGYSPEAAFRLLLADRDVVGGVYPLKREDWPMDGVPLGTNRQRFEELYARYTVNTGRLGEDVALVIDGDGFMKVREVPTGFMCIKRRVFDVLIKAYPELQYVHDWPEGSVPKGFHYRFFDVMVDPESNRYLSEDYGFCRLWEKIGGEMYVDANSNLSHSGERLYTGDFGASLRKALPIAVGAPTGQRISVNGLNNLKPNPR